MSTPEHFQAVCDIIKNYSHSKCENGTQNFFRLWSSLVENLILVITMNIKKDIKERNVGGMSSY